MGLEGMPEGGIKRFYRAASWRKCIRVFQCGIKMIDRSPVKLRQLLIAQLLLLLPLHGISAQTVQPNDFSRAGFARCYRIIASVVIMQNCKPRVLTFPMGRGFTKEARVVR